LRRNLIALNLLLLVLIGLSGWRLRVMYEERLRRQAEFMRAPAAAAPPPVVLIPPPPGQVSAINYLEVAEKLPFSKDRNPTVVQEVVAPKPMPALPRYYGMMNFGAGPRLILAAAAGAPQKNYGVGDTIGEFKLAKVAQSGLVFEWDGKEVPASYEELRDRSTAPPAGASTGAAPVSAGTAPTPQAASGVKQIAPVTSVSSTEASKPGIDIGSSIKACQPGDNSPAGAVVDGYRKLVTETPFGKSCRWEKIN